MWHAQINITPLALHQTGLGLLSDTLLMHILYNIFPGQSSLFGQEAVFMKI